jgi:hypothetical protein
VGLTEGNSFLTGIRYGKKIGLLVDLYDNVYNKMEVFMVLTIRQEEFQLMKMIVLDKDRDEALRLIKSFVAKLEQQDNQGLKSHLDR